MYTKKITTLWAILGLCLLMVACRGSGDEAIDENGPSWPSNSAPIHVMVNTSLTTWVNDAAVRFNNAEIESSSGQPYYIVLQTADAGQAVAAFSGDQEYPALWIPDNKVWADLLERQSGAAQFPQNCMSVAESPLVIAMWQPLAESLGWPGRSIGWLDIANLAADESAWQYYSGGQYGPSLRLGHTHPGLSATGVNTLLAVVQSAQSTTTAVSVNEIHEPLVQASLSSFEGGVTWFSSATNQLGLTMLERGPGYIDAAVMYESDVIQSRGGEQALVPIYPLEGTFMADHPACVNGAESADIQNGAIAFRNFLLEADSQERATVTGLRPVNNPDFLDRLNSFPHVDTSEPRMVFDQPSMLAIDAVQDVWQGARKPVNLVMLLDVSDSMSGDKIESMKAAAVQFVDQMRDEDRLSLVAFSNRPMTLYEYRNVGASRGDLVNGVARLETNGATALYDSLFEGASIVNKTTSSQATNVVILLTDGQDTASTRRYSQDLIDTVSGNNTTVFTIAYGSDADEFVLENIARETNGNYYLGTEASIDDIYQDMSAAFGGSVGIGR